MKTKKLSNLLIETRVRLDFTQQDMAFVLSKRERIYGLYEKGRFDKTHSVRKDKLRDELAMLELEIKKKILFLETALRKLQMNTTTYTPKENIARKKLLIKSVQN